MKKTFLFLLLLNSISLSAKNTIYIIVHGTWAIEADWWHPGGDFYEELKNMLDPSDNIFSFAWDGDNNDTRRHVAAQRILQLVKSYYNIYDNIVVITHSHGGNVVNLATQMAEPDHSQSGWLWNEDGDPLINIVYAMGTPVHKDYYPNMNVIGNFYNLYSHGDHIQPVLGVYGKTYPHQENLANISVMIDDSAPGHSGLHCRPLAKEIVLLHTWIQRKTSKEPTEYLEGILWIYEHDNAYSKFTYYPTSELLQQNNEIPINPNSENIELIESEYIALGMLFDEHRHLLSEEKIALLENKFIS